MIRSGGFDRDRNGRRLALGERHGRLCRGRLSRAASRRRRRRCRRRTRTVRGRREPDDAPAGRATAAGGLGRRDLHHHRHAGPGGAGHSGCWLDAGSRYAKEAVRFDRITSHQCRGDSSAAQDRAERGDAVGADGGEELTSIMASMDAAYGSAKWCKDPSKPADVSTSSKITDIMAQLPRSRGAAAGVGRLARHRRADAPRLRPLRRAVQQGRAGARLRRYRRDVAARSTTCRRTSSLGSSIGSGNRCGRSTCRCTRTCG